MSALSAKELNEYYEAEAFASHIGQFIHKDGILTHLRNELSEIPAIEWMIVKEGEKTPVHINVHHTPEELFEVHEKLAALHRKYEQRVNYFKAKMKNLTTMENARIAKHNSDLQNEASKQNEQLRLEYETKMKEYNEKLALQRAKFEEERQEKIKKIANMRIVVDPRFQEVIDSFLKNMEDTEKDF